MRNKIFLLLACSTLMAACKTIRNKSDRTRTDTTVLRANDDAGAVNAGAINAGSKTSTLFTLDGGGVVLPAALKGQFEDDYGSSYTITDRELIQRPGNSYHLIRCDSTAQFLIARNDSSNKTEPGLYTRIDYMFFSGMAPWNWGYCLTVYNATSDSAAVAATAADRSNPRKGCNGFPFTRMKQYTSMPTRSAGPATGAAAARPSNRGASSF